MLAGMFQQFPFAVVSFIRHMSGHCLLVMQSVELCRYPLLFRKVMIVFFFC